jgi:uncharacterized protein (DUF2062 family)
MDYLSAWKRGRQACVYQEKELLFSRRRPAGFLERVRVTLWPRRSFGRSVRYVLLRLKRLRSSPHRIAVGAAAGVFAIWTPFLGLQLILAGLISWVLRGSILASLLSSFAGNPLTYPLIWFSTFNLGNALLGAEISLRIVDLQSKAVALRDSMIAGSPDQVGSALEAMWPLFKPMVIGSLPLGGLAAFATYMGVRKMIAASNARRQQRLHLRTA